MTDTHSTIVCLGWGSLIWDPDNLPVEHTDPVESAWMPDGPLLPVEFARHSGGNRMTLVLVPDRKAVPVLWTPLLVADLETAKRSLAARECRRKDRRPPTDDTIRRFVDSSCGWWSRDDSQGGCIDIIGRWAVSRSLLAVVWTDLPARFNEIDGRIPTAEQVIDFLQGRKGKELKKARDYITRAPKQISTDYRNQIEAKLGWRPTGVV